MVFPHFAEAETVETEAVTDLAEIAVVAAEVAIEG